MKIFQKNIFKLKFKVNLKFQLKINCDLSILKTDIKGLFNFITFVLLKYSIALDTVMY